MNLYQARHCIENFFATWKQYRAIAIRDDKLAQIFVRCLFRDIGPMAPLTTRPKQKNSADVY